MCESHLGPSRRANSASLSCWSCTARLELLSVRLPGRRVIRGQNPSSKEPTDHGSGMSSSALGSHNGACPLRTPSRRCQPCVITPAPSPRPASCSFVPVPASRGGGRTDEHTRARVARCEEPPRSLVTRKQVERCHTWKGPRHPEQPRERSPAPRCPTPPPELPHAALSSAPRCPTLPPALHLPRSSSPSASHLLGAWPPEGYLGCGGAKLPGVRGNLSPVCRA